MNMFFSFSVGELCSLSEALSLFYMLFWFNGTLTALFSPIALVNLFSSSCAQQTKTNGMENTIRATSRVNIHLMFSMGKSHDPK